MSSVQEMAAGTLPIRAPSSAMRRGQVWLDYMRLKERLGGGASRRRSPEPEFIELAKPRFAAPERPKADAFTPPCHSVLAATTVPDYLFLSPS